VPDPGDAGLGSARDQPGRHCWILVWLESNLGPPGSSKDRIRELTYAALITHLESDAQQE